MISRENIAEYLFFLKWELLYSIVTTIYLVSLNILNSELNAIHFLGPLELLLYEDSKPVHYFIWALILFIVGVIIITCRVMTVIREKVEYEEIIMIIIGIIICIILLSLIICFIDNPILRAILAVVSSGAAVVYVSWK